MRSIVDSTVSPARNTEPFPLYPRSTSHLRTLSSTSLNRVSPPLRFTPSPSTSPHHSRAPSPRRSRPPSPSRSPTHSRSTSSSSVRFTGRLELPLFSPSDSHEKAMQQLTARLVEMERGYQELERAYDIVKKERDFYRELANPSRNHSVRLETCLDTEIVHLRSVQLPTLECSIQPQGLPHRSPSSSGPASPARDTSANRHNWHLDAR